MTEEREMLKSVVLKIHSEDYMKMLKMNKALKTFTKRMKEEKEKRNENKRNQE